MRSIGGVIDRLLFPDAGRCPICSREGAFGICEYCQSSLKALTLPYDISAYIYDGIVRDIIHSYKFDGRKYLYKTIAALMSDKAKNADADIITNVPVHKKRRRQRGYDQSELIAKELSNLIGIRYARLINKDVNTVAQSTLTKEERLKNAAGKYSLSATPDISGKRVLVIDDVLTTGATMRECCGLLSSAGAVPIPLTFAKTHDNILDFILKENDHDITEDV